MLRRASLVSSQNVAVFSGAKAAATYRQLDAAASLRARRLLLNMGLRRGDRVVLFAANCVEYVECLFACWYAGLVATPVNARLHPRELAYIMNDTRAKICFSTADLADSAREAARLCETGVEILAAAEDPYTDSDALADIAETSPDDAAWLFYTSGTTGRPKGAMLTHRNLLAMTMSCLAEVVRVRPGDAIIHAAPMSHGSGLYILPHVAAMGAQVIPESGGFDPAEAWALIGAHRRCVLFAAPTMVDRLATYAENHEVNSDNLKRIVVGGAPFYTDSAKRAIARIGPKIVQIYGQGETPMTISVLPAAACSDPDEERQERRFASVGYPHAILEVMVADAEGRRCSPGAIGEILVKGDTVMKGYWEDPDATRVALKDGWLHTGDLGAFDEEGFLFLKGRCKELIISGGSNIYPSEVEDILLLHPDVASAAVIGRPHREYGEEVVAFVAPRPGAALDEAVLDAWCIQHIARFKRPRVYRFVDCLPQNAYGKVLKTELEARMRSEWSAQ